MKRTNFKLQTSNFKLQTLLFAALFSTIVFTSCSSDKDETTTPTETFADKIIGRWMCTGVDGRPCPTNYYYVMNFVSPTKVYRSYSPTTSIGLDNFWEAQYECVAKITDRKLTVTGQHNVNLTSESQYSLQSITETEMDLVANHTVIFKGRQIDMPAHNHERFTKITKDYSKDIIGTWEGHITSNESA